MSSPRAMRLLSQSVTQSTTAASKRPLILPSAFAMSIGASIVVHSAPRRVRWAAMRRAILPPAAAARPVPREAPRHLLVAGLRRSDIEQPRADLPCALLGVAALC